MFKVFLGIIILIIGLAIGVVLAGQKQIISPGAEIIDNNTTVTRIVALGDSITDGNAGQRSYRYKLTDLLNNFNVVIEDQGKAGRTTSDLANDLNKNINNILGYNPQFVLLMIGTNDVTKYHNSPEKLSIAEANLSNILEKINLYSPSTQILLATVTPRSDCKNTLCGYVATTVKWNEMVKKLAIQKKNEGQSVILVDVYNESGVTNSDIQSDGLHLLGSGSDKVAVTWAKYLF